MSVVLLVVDGAYPARGGGVQLSPRFVPEQGLGLGRGAFAIRLVRPDGTTKLATAQLDFAHVSGPRPPYALCRVLDVTCDEIPIGTQVRVSDPRRTPTSETPE